MLVALQRQCERMNYRASANACIPCSKTMQAHTLQSLCKRKHSTSEAMQARTLHTRCTRVCQRQVCTRGQGNCVAPKLPVQLRRVWELPQHNAGQAWQLCRSHNHRDWDKK